MSLRSQSPTCHQELHIRNGNAHCNVDSTHANLRKRFSPCSWRTPPTAPSARSNMPPAPPSHTRATQLSAPHHTVSTVAKSKGYLSMPTTRTLPTHSTHTARRKEADSCFRARGAKIFLPRQEVVNIARLARSLCLWCRPPPGPCGGDTATQGGRSGVAHKLRYGAFGAWGKRKWRSQGHKCQVACVHARHTGPQHLWYFQHLSAPTGRCTRTTRRRAQHGSHRRTIRHLPGLPKW